MGLEQVRNEAKGESATRQFAALLAEADRRRQAGLLSALADRRTPPLGQRLWRSWAVAKTRQFAWLRSGPWGGSGQRPHLELLAPLTTSDTKAENVAARASLVRLQSEGLAPAIVRENLATAQRVA